MGDVVDGQFGEEKAVDLIVEVIQEMQPEDLLCFAVKNGNPLMITSTYDELTLYRSREVLRMMVEASLDIELSD